ncbi:MAG: chorismate synthase [Flavobacteriales bacterium]|nr:chorismate synthase [Flavobacteriales bacterium]|tara:strand:+ start:228 stop:1304 length:1077 start_codon:yes stop_codon:yes gene_type:complete
MANMIGKIFRLVSFGESHGSCIGGVIDGCPAGFQLDSEYVNLQLMRRSPGQSKIVSQRKEPDKVEFLSGIYNGLTTGTPIGFIVKNKDVKSSDYNNLKNVFRPSHADFTYKNKYGIRDFRGGGRSSARETVSRVVAGSIAQQLLKEIGVDICAYVSKVGSVKVIKHYKDLDLSQVDSNVVRCPDADKAKDMIKLISTMQESGDTIGGEIRCVVNGVPVGWGEPVFNKLHADIGHAMLSINAVKSFKYGFLDCDVSSSSGSVVNDVISDISGKTTSNYSGGIQGGISNGNDIYCDISFKPVSTIMKDQQSIDNLGNKILVKASGRHDSCVVPRAVPIVESMMSLVLLDHYLLSKLNVFE